MHIFVLYKDNYFCICEKPPGIISESDGLPSLLSDQIGQAAYPVHRLDQGTGGVCVLALSREACTAATNLFQSGKIHKEYLAVITGHPGMNCGKYIDMLYHDHRTNKTFVVDTERKGVKKAECDWQLMASVLWENQLLSLVRVKLYSGRTHQIRVQFASRGFPLVGDRRYGSRIKSDYPSLWSESISFEHPFKKGVSCSAESRPAESFPWNLFSSERFIDPSSGELRRPPF